MKTAPAPAAVPPATPVGLGALVEVAPGAVVSRTLHQSPAGTLTIFAFAAGQGLSEHAAPFEAWVQIVEGEAILTIGGQEVTARAGEIVCMPARIPHALRAPAPFKMLLAMFKSGA
jgi:quercetin dioxygenase-like cupin family protein